LTVAVARTDVQPLLRADQAKVVVESRGTRREYEVISLLRRADRQFRRLTVRAGNTLAGHTLGSVGFRDAYDVAVLAVRKTDGWKIAPSGVTTLEAGDELFAVGDREKLDALADAVSGASTQRGDD
jgi:uncharacterized protein with PhoU and TrkA domain